MKDFDATDDLPVDELFPVAIIRRGRGVCVCVCV